MFNNRIINLIHDDGVKRAEFKSSEYTLPAEFEKKKFTLLSFNLLSYYPFTESLKTHAAKRIFNSLEETNCVVTYNLESCSALSPILFWDVAHFLPLNGQILVVEENCEHSCILESRYYKESFTKKIIDKNVICYEKVKVLASEGSDSLGQWSFCIPTGGDDSTFINKVVKRIIDMSIPSFEILLCGQPASGFKYGKYVKIIDFPDNEEVIYITKKKNMLVEHAQYPNVCILHDRVLLPLNFLHAVSTFGESFPFYTFQSIYFTDRNGLSFNRYSDAGVGVSGIERNHANDGSVIFYDNGAPFVKGIFSFSHAKLYSHGNNYLTGSLCLCKKSLWQTFPQSEILNWAEYEDIEQSCRAADSGIPCLINPHSLTSSLTARHLLLSEPKFQTDSNKFLIQSDFLSIFFFKKKPLFKLTKKQYNNNFVVFCKIYDIEYSVLNDISLRSLLPFGWRRLHLISKVIHLVPIERTEEYAINLNKNISKYLILEQEMLSQRNIISNIISGEVYSDVQIRSMILGRLHILISQLSDRFFISPFSSCNSTDFFPKRITWLHKIGLIRAVRRIKKGDLVYVDMTHKQLTRTLKGLLITTK